MIQIKTGFVEAVERFIPSKMTKTKYSVPWIDVTIKRLVKKRHKLYLDGVVNRGHKQTDLIIMDFAKAFDKVPHRRLLHKVDYYGIRGSTHK